MKKLEYISRVLLIMNEAGSSDTNTIFTAGADTTQVDRYIEGSFPESWRICVSLMPKAWFTNKSFKGYPLVPDLKNGTGFIVLPEDFYTLNSFKMEGWVKSVYTASMENDRTESISSNEYTRGSRVRPSATLDNKEVSVAVPVFTKVIILDAEQVSLNAGDVVYYPSLKKLYTIPVSGKWLGALDVEGSEDSKTAVVAGDVSDIAWDYDMVQYTEAGTANAKAGTATKLSATSVVNGSYYKAGSSYYVGKDNVLTATAATDGVAQVLKYYSLPKGLSSHSVEHALYIPMVKELKDYGETEDLGIDPRILEPLAYLSASSVFVLFEKNEIAKALQERALQMMPGTASRKGDVVTIRQ